MFDSSFIDDMTDLEQSNATAAAIERLARYIRNNRAVHSTVTGRYSSPEELFSACIETGRKIFDLPTGIVSQVQESQYLVLDVQSDMPGLEIGMTFDLSGTYCHDVIRKGRTVAHTEVGESEEGRGHPCYQSTGLESYLAAPIPVGARIFGTLNFSSPEPRHPGFTELEREQVELLADTIGRSLEVIAWQQSAAQQADPTSA